MSFSLQKSLTALYFYRVNFRWKWRFFFFSYLTTKCCSLLWISLICSWNYERVLLIASMGVWISEMCIEGLIVNLKLRKDINSFYHCICPGNTTHMSFRVILIQVSCILFPMHVVHNFWYSGLQMCWNLKNHIFNPIFQEDFLATDDLFVDYFNAYLSLPVSIYTDNLRRIRPSQPWLLMNNFTPFNGQVKYLTLLLNKAFYEVSV